MGDIRVRYDIALIVLALEDCLRWLVQAVTPLSLQSIVSTTSGFLGEVDVLETHQTGYDRDIGGEDDPDMDPRTLNRGDGRRNNANDLFLPEPPTLIISPLPSQTRT